MSNPLPPDELVARMRVHLANAQLAQSAYAAMDEARRFILATNKKGIILWSNPQAAKLLERSLPDMVEPDIALPKHITKWLTERHLPGAGRATQLVLSSG